MRFIFYYLISINICELHMEGIYVDRRLNASGTISINYIILYSCLQV